MAPHGWAPSIQGLRSLWVFSLDFCTCIGIQMLGRVAGATGVATVDQHSTALGSRKVELKIAIGLWEGTSPQAGHLYKFIYINYISSRTSSNIKHDLPLRSIDGFSTLASCIVIPCGDRLSHSIRRRPKKSIRNLTVLPKKGISWRASP